MKAVCRYRDCAARWIGTSRFATKGLIRGANRLCAWRQASMRAWCSTNAFSASSALPKSCSPTWFLMHSFHIRQFFQNKCLKPAVAMVANVLSKDFLCELNHFRLNFLLNGWLLLRGQIVLKQYYNFIGLVE